MIKFFNSALGIWLLTTVFGGIAVWSFERYLDDRNQIATSASRADKIDLELEGRVAQYASWVDGIVEKNTESRFEVDFLPCVTNKFLHESIKRLGEPPNIQPSKYQHDISCPEMFKLLPMFEELANTSIVGLYLERVLIEESLFPAKQVLDDETNEAKIVRDDTAARAISAWRNAINPFITPDSLTGIEIGDKKPIDYTYFHEGVTDYLYRSPRQKGILHYGDCFRC